MNKNHFPCHNEVIYRKIKNSPIFARYSTPIFVHDESEGFIQKRPESG